MRGLIYKDTKIFFKSIDKKFAIVVPVAIVLLIFNAGVYAGLFASVMLAMTVGMQNIMCCLIATAIPLRSIAKMNIVESIENVE